MAVVTDVSFEPQRVEKPWGWELVWALTDDYAGKLLFVRAGHALSLQYHEQKDESWYVQEGRAELLLGAVGGQTTSRVIEPGDAFHFPPRTVHRVKALEDLLVVEVSTPQLDDVVRLADEYGRASS
jgi:mannose-6-phosphate isomerase-like protein (cupin superfamily)